VHIRSAYYRTLSLCLNLLFLQLSKKNTENKVIIALYDHSLINFSHWFQAWSANQVFGIHFEVSTLLLCEHQVSESGNRVRNKDKGDQRKTVPLRANLKSAPRFTSSFPAFEYLTLYVMFDQMGVIEFDARQFSRHFTS